MIIYMSESALADIEFHGKMQKYMSKDWHSEY